jgi:hypothetical protein
MSYNGMATPVKQFYTEADATLKVLIDGVSTRVAGVCMLKGVTINPSGGTCHVKIYSGNAATAANLIYENKLSDSAVYQEYIAATGIKSPDGIYVELVAGTTSVSVIWQ